MRAKLIKGGYFFAPLSILCFILAGCTPKPLNVATMERISQVEDVDYIDRFGQGLLHVASQEGKMDIVQALVDKGADLNMINVRCETALSLAILNQHNDIAEYLIQRGADVNPRGTWLTPLVAAIKVGNQVMALELLKRGSSVHTRGRGGETPLFYAAFFDQLTVAKQLIERGADVNVETKDGRTPLHAALLRSNHNAADLLMEKGATIKAADQSEQGLLATAYLYEYAASKVEKEGKTKSAIRYYKKAASFYELSGNRFKSVSQKYLTKSIGLALLSAAYVAGSAYSAAYNTQIGANTHGFGVGFVDYTPLIGVDSKIGKDMSVQKFYKNISQKCLKKSAECNQKANGLR